MCHLFDPITLRYTSLKDKRYKLVQVSSKFFNLEVYQLVPSFCFYGLAGSKVIWHALKGKPNWKYIIEASLQWGVNAYIIPFLMMINILIFLKSSYQDIFFSSYLAVDTSLNFKGHAYSAVLYMYAWYLHPKSNRLSARISKHLQVSSTSSEPWIY